jgi:hypothetical protein
MAIYRTTLRVPMPQVALFTYMATYSNAKSWDPIVKDAREEQPLPAALGAMFHLDVKTLRGTRPFTYTIVEFDSPNTVVLEAITNTYYSREAISVRKVSDEESELTYRATLRLRGFAAILNGFLPIVIHRIGLQARQGLWTQLTRT